MEEGKKTPLEMAVELDEMERDVTSDEATFLERALKDLRSGKELRPKHLAKLEAMHEKYLGEPDEEEDGPKRPVDDDENRDDLDQADF
jgi:hypothetical protein